MIIRREGQGLLAITQPDHARHLRHDRRIAWATGFEDFRDAWQAAGNVLRTRYFARRLGKYAAGGDHVAGLDVDVAHASAVPERKVGLL